MNKNTQKSLIIAVLAVFVGIFAFSLTYAIASSITAKNVIKLVNESRAKEGLKALEENPKLSAAAAGKAEDMLKNDYFAHNSPTGKTPWYWMEKSGYDYKHAGENLAMNFDSAEEEQKAWMKSESHRKNILNANYQEIGVAVKEGKIDGKNTTVAVQMFGSRPNFVPVSQKAPEKSLEENKVAVLGDENKNILPLENPEAFKEDVLVDNFMPENLVVPAAAPAGASTLWSTLKEKIANFNRPGWLTPAALWVLWIILIGNIFFIGYSITKKLLLSKTVKEEEGEERKIPVKNLEKKGKAGSGEAVSVKVHILHLPHLKPSA